MDIYHFHPITREYLGAGLADPDPMVEDNWLIPANATPDAPLAAGQNEVAVFIDGAWLVKPDFRGQVYYDAAGDEITITEIGVTPAPEWTAEPPPPPPPTLADLRTTTLRDIATACDAEINAVKAGYPDSEILTWDKQETEARAFIADAQAATPLLDALSVAREIAKAELAARVIAKADAFAAYTGALIGKRQKLEDQMTALFADPENPPTAEQIEAVQWVTEAPQP